MFPGSTSKYDTSVDVRGRFSPTQIAIQTCSSSIPAKAKAVRFQPLMYEYGHRIIMAAVCT